MIIIDDVYISDDIIEECFICDLKSCKGACCVEGDLGAPLDFDELLTMEEIYKDIEPYLSQEGKEVIAEEGVFVKDWEGDFSTPVINGKECAYAIYDENKVLKCAIEIAHKEGKIDFPKPISCHLYPIRITEYKDYEALNYNRWNICKAACKLGKDMQIPIYKFLKEPLIRKYGKDWYNELDRIALHLKEKKEN